MQVTVSCSDVAQFWRDGAIRLRGVFDRKWIDRLREGVEQNFADPGPDACHYTLQDDPGAFYDDYCNWTRIDAYADFIRRSPAAEIVARILRSSQVRIYHEHVLVKEPGTRERTPWHHDLPYYGVEGKQLCSIWLPLDRVPLDACPEFVAASHATGERFVPRLFEDRRPYGATGDGYADIPDYDSQRERFELLSWELDIGDCIVFHMATVHGAPGTAALTHRRRAFSTRWLGDDARFASRPWPTSPPFHDVLLQPGDTMDHELFPVIWQSQT